MASATGAGNGERPGMERQPGLATAAKAVNQRMGGQEPRRIVASRDGSAREPAGYSINESSAKGGFPPQTPGVEAETGTVQGYERPGLPPQHTCLSLSSLDVKKKRNTRTIRV